MSLHLSKFVHFIKDLNHENHEMIASGSLCRLFTREFFFSWWYGFLKYTLIAPFADTAPNIEIVLALAIKTFTLALFPFGDQPCVLFRLAWKPDSSINTQLFI